jgi:hypothetical protein
MSKGIFEKREQAFEAVFFARLGNERIAELRAKQAAEEAKIAISQSTGISDPAVLERILSSDIDPRHLQALSLVPVVITAWASGEVTPAERDAALQAAEKEGVSKKSGAHALLESWLDEAPSPDLEKTWAEYVGAVLDQLDDEAREALKQDLMSRCRQVARASGGILGLGSKTSHAETLAMQRLEEAMS